MMLLADLNYNVIVIQFLFSSLSILPINHDQWIPWVWPKPKIFPCTHKLRLVAQGFTQVKGADYDKTFCPVVRMESLRTLIAKGVFSTSSV